MLAAFIALALLQQPIINDVSKLNPTPVREVVAIHSQAEAVAALSLAQTLDAGVSISGMRHSQGGHVAAPDGVVLDMTPMNQVLAVDADAGLVRVEAGASWDDVQQALNPHGLAVAVMQSSNIFTVGGTLSVNAHGRDPRFGPMVDSVASLTVLGADGVVVKASRTENKELFFAVIGGYGLCGLILEAELKTVPNSVLEKSVITVPVAKYVPWLREHVLGQPEVELHYARPSVLAKDQLASLTVVTYRRTPAPVAAPQLKGERAVAMSKSLLALSRHSETGKAVRWYLQEHLVDVVGKTERTSRNNAMRPEVRFLDYSSPKDTDILQEYFVPLEQFEPFMAALRATVATRHINLLSATVRYTPANTDTTLSYSATPTLAVVLYLNIERSAAGLEAAQTWTQELVDAACSRQGTYYLPYQGFPTREQFERCYPRAAEFRALRKRFDRHHRWTNRFAKVYLD